MSVTTILREWTPTPEQWCPCHRNMHPDIPVHAEIGGMVCVGCRMKMEICGRRWGGEECGLWLWEAAGASAARRAREGGASRRRYGAYRPEAGGSGNVAGRQSVGARGVRRMRLAGGARENACKGRRGKAR